MADGGEGPAMSHAGESPTGNESDGDFDPSADMLVNDFDDEHTLDEEEEIIDGSENAEDEIDKLQEEGEMPLEELLAMYGYEAGPDGRKNRQQGDSDRNETIPSTSDQSLDAASSSRDCSADGWQCAPNLNMSGEESDSDDEDYEEAMSDSAEEWRRTIKVGEEYQAVVPDGLCEYDDVPAYENEDKILWDPSRLPDEKVEEFLKNVKLTTNEYDTAVQPEDQCLQEVGPIGDDEQALYLLIQCDHQPDEALRRRKMQAAKVSLFDQTTPFSDEECTSFEEGLANYGKDFHAIQRNKVTTRSVRELVHFYYLWKKTERHDVFVSKYRIKRNFIVHPTATDYMDRILDELENSAAPPVPASISFRTTNAAHSMIPSSMTQKTSHACETSTSSSENQQGEIEVQQEVVAPAVTVIQEDGSVNSSSSTNNLANGSKSISTSKTVNTGFHEGTNLNITGDSIEM